MTTRWFEDPDGHLRMMNAESAAEQAALFGECRRWYDRQLAALTGVPGLRATEEPGRTVLIHEGGAWRCSCGGHGTARSREAAAVELQKHRRTWHAAGRTRLRKTASPPTLTGLRQAYLDAKSGAAAFTALLAFLAALEAVRAEAELDSIGEDPPVRVDPGARVGALVCVVLGLLAWYGLISAAVMGSLVVLWVVGVPAAAASWGLGRVVTARRRRDG